MFSRYGLVLMVTHACNLRCSYCYTGDKFRRVMPREIGRRAIERALASLANGGTLELGFFGGEPLLEAGLVRELLTYASSVASRRGQRVAAAMTTNGTAPGEEAWGLMTDPAVELSVSFDGTPAVHDRHRPTRGGEPSSTRVLGTIRKLLASGKDLRVVMVVRPDTVDELAAGLRFLFELGVRHVEPSLDLWTRWSQADVVRLEAAIARAAEVWRGALPHCSVGWFDEKAAHLLKVRMERCARCGFGQGEIAVAPSGRLYPCERLIGEDAADNPMRLPGHVMQGEDFLSLPAAAGRTHEACDACEMATCCSSVCRCSNYVRTGDVKTPDGLLCAWNQACLSETARVLSEIAVPPPAVRLGV